MNAGKRRSPNGLLLEFTILALILIAVVLAFSSDAIVRFFEKREYQRGFSEYVSASAKEFGLDENLVYSVIKAESDFDKDAVSASGAIGLMQIMPQTYLGDICGAIGTNADVSALFDPETNIRAGTYYLSHLIDYFGSVRSAVAAYNAGMGNVSKWLSDIKICDDAGELIAENIPFYQTRVYVSRVEYYFEQYSFLYPRENTAPDDKIEDKHDDPYSEPLVLTEGEVYLLAEKYGDIYSVDPCLILAIANIESSFNAHAVSRSNAIGLMQIKPSTYLGDIRPGTGTSSDENVLYDPEINIKCGAYYLSWLYKRLGGTREVVVAYYYGIGNVKRMLESDQYSDDGQTLIYENIPNNSAKSYLRRVMEAYERYKPYYEKLNQ